MRYAYSDVRASYTGAKAYQERHDVMFRFFARPLSFPVAWLALRLGMEPNHVTFISLALNALGLAFMASGSRSLMVWGVVIILAALVLDAADGNMARTAKRFSPLGEWLEGIGSYLLCAGFHLCGAVGAWLAFGTNDPVTQWPRDPANAGVLLVFGAVAATSITASILAAAKFSSVFPDVDRGKVVARSGEGVYGFLFTVGRNLSFASGLVLPLTLVGILVRRYEVILAAFALLNFGMMLVVLGRCYILARRAAVAGMSTRV
jgi:phosphatidylglycerophosphate synthase